MELSKRFLLHTVELLSGLALLVCGIIVQASAADPGSATADASRDRTLLITGGVMVAFGGILLSWVASRVLAQDQAEQAVAAARAEVDQKLDNLSRVLGQAAGQISQAVEQSELDQIPPSTGFALVSQATRMIYGQVNEIAVIRGSEFDSAYLLQTASQLDELARQLSSSGQEHTTKDVIEEVRRQLEDVQANLAAAPATGQRTFATTGVTCPKCGAQNPVRLGTVPGETAAARCQACGTSFNAHRASNGTAFSRPRQLTPNGASAQSPSAPEPARLPSRWEFECPECSERLFTRVKDDATRTLFCTGCSAALQADPTDRSVTPAGKFRLVKSDTFSRSGNRPKFICPDCDRRVKAAIHGADGWVGICTDDLVALTVTDEEFEAFLASDSTAAAN